VGKLNRRLDTMTKRFEKQLHDCLTFCGDYINSRPMTERRQVVEDVRSGKTEQNALLMKAFEAWKQTISKSDFEKLEQYCEVKNDNSN